MFSIFLISNACKLLGKKGQRGGEVRAVKTSMSSGTVCDINATVRAVQQMPAYWKLLNLTF